MMLASIHNRRWPGEDEASQQHRRRVIKAEPWKLTVLENMYELNSSPTRLEILVAAVETGLQERTVRNWVRQRKKEVVHEPSSPASLLPSASLAPRRRRKIPIVENTRGYPDSLLGAAQPTEILDYSTMTIGAPALAPPAQARTSTPPAPRRTSARLSARISGDTAVASSEARRRALASPTLGYIPEVFGVPVDPGSNAQDLDEEDHLGLQQDDICSLPKDSSVYLISQLARKFSQPT